MTKALISWLLSGTLLFFLSCDSKDSAKGASLESTGNETPTTASTKTTAASEETGKPATEMLPCAEWFAQDLIKTHCGSDVPFINKNGDYPNMCQRLGKNKENGRVEVGLESLGKTGWHSTSRFYPKPPSIETNEDVTVIRTRRFPYVLTLRLTPPPLGSKGSKGSKGRMCTDEQALALLDAIVSKITEQAEPPSKANRACDKLLRTIDIRKICKGKPAISSQIYPTMFEDGKSLYCNRKGRDLVFMVTKHASAQVASAGAAVASDDPNAGVRSKGIFVIELKPSRDSTLCSKADLADLADLVASRLPAK